MKAYAHKIGDGNCLEVGTGTNEDFYKSIGMELYDDIVQAWDGCYYHESEAPEKPAEKIAEEKLATQTSLEARIAALEDALAELAGGAE